MKPTWRECWLWAAHWSQRWFLDPEGRDRLLLPDGIEGGWATHVEAHAALLRVALRATGQDVEVGRQAWQTRMKQRGLDRPARAMGMRALSLTGGQRTEISPGGVALIVEIPTPSTQEPVELVAERLAGGERSLAVADPRAGRAWRRRGASPAFLLLGSLAERRAVREGQQAVDTALDQIEAAPPTLELDGQDLTRRALAALRTALARSIAWLRPEWLALQHFLDAAQPRSIAVASDQHRIGRLVTHLAGSAPVVVLQHGLPQATIGYLPVVADRVAIWSLASRDWFVRHETAPDALVITGNPRFDALHALDREIQRQQAEAALRVTGSPRILLALSPASTQRNTDVLRLALDALGTVSGGMLVIKLHPGHRAWQFVSEIVRSSPLRERIRIAHREPLAPLLAWADVLFVQRSTVAAEALALGTPVIILQPATTQTSSVHPELEQVGLPTACDGPTAASMVGELAGQAERERFFTIYRERIEWLNGPSDGRSAERIAELLRGTTG